MSQLPVIIAGGGIAGLAAALALGPRDGLMLEREAAFGNAGAGLQLGPNAVRALQKLGAWDAVAPYTTSPPEIHIWDGLSGKRLKCLALGSAFEKRFGAPYRVAHRADLHQALWQVVSSRANLITNFSMPVTAVEEKINSIVVSSGAKIFEGQQLWAADGVHSAIRQLLLPGTTAVNAGEVFHRALLKNVSNISGVAFDCINLWMFPGSHVVHYPVSKEQHLNVVAVTPQAATLQHFYEGACPSLKHLIDQMGQITLWPGLYVAPLPSWMIGHTTLLGDAAHGTLPYLAQGAAMALEDAALLANLRERGSVESFYGQRHLRTTRLHEKTLAAGKAYHMDGIMRQLRNLSLAASPTTFLQAQLSWIYRY